MLNAVFFDKLRRVGQRKAEAWLGRLRPLAPTLEAMAVRPYELHMEVTNLCNANCVFCPYQYQQRPTEFMDDAVYTKALEDYVQAGGGSLFLTPIVGDALIDRKILDRIRQARAYKAIDRIKLITNAIMVDRYGAEAILTSGVSSILFSIGGFEEAMYERLYRSKQYKRVLANLLSLFETNEKLGRPVHLVIGLRSDRPLDEVMAQPDFQPFRAFNPAIDFTWSFTSAGGRITRDALPEGMRLRRVGTKREPCVVTYNGPMVLTNGDVVACSCVAAMDAVADLKIGNIMEQNLVEIWTGEAMRRLRANFGTSALNPTCQACDMYRDLELYRTREGRERAEINRRRLAGEIVHREAINSIDVGG